MGVFQQMVEVVNRTSKTLNLRFDGQDMELVPNYTPEGEPINPGGNMIPVQTVGHAKSQNVLMGSEDPQNPSEYVVLVGLRAKPGQKQRDDITHLEQSNELTRVKLEEYLDDPTQKIIVAGRRISRGEARPVKDIAPFDPRQS